ncbi:MAG: hypothetical protein AAF639_23330 [Chloroflexota bacterium]
MAEKLDTIMELLANDKLTRDEKWALLEAELRYLTGVKNRLPDEVIDQSVRKAFAEEAEIMETIFERKMELGRQEGLQVGRLEGRLEAEREFQQEWEASRQKTLVRNREIILGVVNHTLKLGESEQEKIANQLEKIDDEEVLNQLINTALDASGGGDFTFFMMRLMFESESKESA